MDRIKAVYDFGDGNKVSVTIIGTMADGRLICVDDSTGFITKHPAEYVTVELADWNSQSDSAWLAEQVQQLRQDIRDIQTYGLRLNNG